MNRLHLFDAFGIELEYMIVDRAGLQVRPLADSLLGLLAGGRCVGDVDCGPITLSNELALHVVEFKTGQPTAQLFVAAEQFRSALDATQASLDRLHARLLPSAMHPLMDPRTELVLWPHENYPIYDAYDRVFGCRSHGWANVQSVHLNLPFADDREFERLHAAVRLVLPILPALAASSPLAGGRYGGFADMRMHYYAGHCAACPTLIGDLIPEPVYDAQAYTTTVIDPIRSQIAALDPERVLDVDFLNARGAIARFDRGSIEIRVIDVQEYPMADLAICAAAIAVLRRLTEAAPEELETQKRFPTERLRAILDCAIRDAEDASIDDTDYLALLQVTGGPCTAGQLWTQLLRDARLESTDVDRLWQPLQMILEQGTLASRIRQSLGTDPAADRIIGSYRELADCLTSWRSFHP